MCPASRPTGPGPATPTPTSTAFAERHHGEAPILVIPDNNGVKTPDTECSNSVFGNAETYLVTDVPNFMQANFNAAIGKHSMAVAGLSAGGTCASILALRNPKDVLGLRLVLGLLVPHLHQRRRAADHRPALRGIEGRLRGPQPRAPARSGTGTREPRRGSPPDSRTHRRWPRPSRWPSWPSGRDEPGLPDDAAGGARLRLLGGGLQGLTALAVVEARPHPGARRRTVPLHSARFPEPAAPGTQQGPDRARQR